MDILNNDIYDIVDSVNDLQQRFIDEESPDTLALGIYGYLSSIHATILQNSIITAGEMGNELFPQKAKFERNVIAHAIIQNIQNINAVPATIHAILGIFEEDLIRYMVSDKFVIDKEISFNIDQYEYHLEYDIIVTRSALPNANYGYSGVYDLTMPNPLSQIKNPYLVAPYMQRYNGKNMIFFYVELMQVTHSVVEKTIITSNLIENKTVLFGFTDQLADFIVKVTDGDDVVYLTPVFEGMGLENNLTDFCYYTYADATHIRVRFDSLSYVPRINAKIEILIKTTKGAEANFEYNNTIYPIISSEKYGYNSLLTYLSFASESAGGQDRKTVDELRKMLPKEALSRGSITCMQDLENYFNMLDTDENRLILSKRVDNQFERSYFAYMILKDSHNNVVPTNTFDISVKFDDFDTHDNRKYVIKPGCYIAFEDINTNSARVIKRTDSNAAMLDEMENNDRTKFLYTCPFMLVVTGDPLYVSYYLTIIDTMVMTDFTYINVYAPTQFICTNVHWYRHYIDKPNSYFLEFAITQNIQNGNTLITFDDNNQVLKNNFRIFAVFYNDNSSNTPYAYTEVEYTAKYDQNQGYIFKTELTTNDVLSDDNMIYINGLHRASTSPSEDDGELLLSPHAGVRIYICANFNEQYGEFGRYDLDSIVPGLEGYTVCNMYTVSGGLNFYENYSEIISSQVKDIMVEDIYTEYQGFYIMRVPCIRRSYVALEENMDEFINNINYKKAYIDNALYILEDNFKIDFKFFNTYGPSRTYTLDRYGYEKKLIDRVNLQLNFEVRLLRIADRNIVDYIIRDIKEIVEDLNELTSLHIPNLITELTNKYKESVEYIEFLGFNDYGPGTQHIYRQEYNVLTGTQDVNMVPEFLTIHTDLDLTPDINIRVV